LDPGQLLGRVKAIEFSAATASAASRRSFDAKPDTMLKMSGGGR
jgi:hypothetical protein